MIDKIKTYAILALGALLALVYFFFEEKEGEVESLKEQALEQKDDNAVATAAAANQQNEVKNEQASQDYDALKRANAELLSRIGAGDKPAQPGA